jgi:hypothetical protein
MATKKRKKGTCRPTFRISEAGHLLSKESSSEAGRLLSTEGKRQKNKRLKRGCLNGVEGTFRLTEKQKKKLPLVLQKAILAHHKKLGKRILK